MSISLIAINIILSEESEKLKNKIDFIGKFDFWTNYN